MNTPKKSPAQLAYEAYVIASRKHYSPELSFEEPSAAWERCVTKDAWEAVADELEDYYRDCFEPRGWY